MVEVVLLGDSADSVLISEDSSVINASIHIRCTWSFAPGLLDYIPVITICQVCAIALIVLKALGYEVEIGISFLLKLKFS